MPNHAITVYWLANGKPHANQIYERLLSNGFRSSDICVLASSNRCVVYEASSKAPEGATAGLIGGGTFGAIWGAVLSGNALAPALAGPFAAAGPLMLVLSGAAIGGVFGSLVGAAFGMLIPEYEPRGVSEPLEEGGLLMSVGVYSATWANRAEAILNDLNARSICREKCHDSASHRWTGTTVATPENA